MMERVDVRHGDASDANAGVVATQVQYDTGAINWHRIDASEAPAATVQQARAILGV
jgi:predicted kinase